MTAVSRLIRELGTGKGRALTDADLEVLRDATADELMEAAIASHPCRNAAIVMQRCVELRAKA